MAEIVIGHQVITLERDGMGDLQIKDVFYGLENRGLNGQGGISCVGPLLGGNELEIMPFGRLFGSGIVKLRSSTPLLFRVSQA